MDGYKPRLKHCLPTSSMNGSSAKSRNASVCRFSMAETNLEVCAGLK